MKRSVQIEIITVGFIIVTSLAAPVLAAISTTGDVDPSDPSTWDSNTVGTIGQIGYGTMSITGGSDVIDNDGYIGRYSGSTGAVSVDGANSTWTNSDYFYVGYYGNGTLGITNGGAVSSGPGYVGYQSGVTGAVTVDGANSTWTNSSSLRVGCSGNGTLNITDGGAVSSGPGYIGDSSDGTGVVIVDGAGSTWTNEYLRVGRSGNGTLNITNGGAVSSGSGVIGFAGYAAFGEITVDGANSIWTNSSSLRVGFLGDGTLNITGGGLVSVAGTLAIDLNGGDDSFINMATGGMLAVFGGDADDLLVDFLGIIEGTDAIRYWDGSGWADITGATLGLDYTLEYLTDGDLTGYTMLTVPEPATMLLFGLGGIALRRKRQR